MPKSADQIVKKWLERTTSSSARQAYIDGVNAVTESPMAKAATPEAERLYLNRIEESVRSGRRTQALLSAPLGRYKDGAMKKGADRLSSGATASLEKARAAYNKWAPIYAQAHDIVQSMPKGTREAAKARSAAVIDMMMDAAGRQ